MHVVKPLRPIAQHARRRLGPAQLERRATTRVRGLLLVSLLTFGLIGLRLVQIQTVSAPQMRRLALEQRLHTIPLSAERGGIFDRNGSDLAISVTRNTIYADPKYVSDPGMYAAKLAPVVGVSETELYQELLDGARRNGRYVVIAKTVADKVSARAKKIVERDNLAGVGFVPESKRVYPSDRLAAPLIGTVGTDQYGLSGLESQYDEMLKGRAGTITVEVDQDGHEIPRTVRKSIPARRGTDLVLVDRPEPAVSGGELACGPGRRAACRRRHRVDHRCAHRRRARDGVGRRLAVRRAPRRPARAQPTDAGRARTGFDEQGDHRRHRVAEGPHHARERVQRSVLDPDGRAHLRGRRAARARAADSG